MEMSVCVWCGKEIDLLETRPQCEEPDRTRKTCWADEDYRDEAIDRAYEEWKDFQMFGW